MGRLGERLRLAAPPLCVLWQTFSCSNSADVTSGRFTRGITFVRCRSDVTVSDCPRHEQKRTGKKDVGRKLKLTSSLPWRHLNTTNNSAKFQTLKPFCFLFFFCTGMWKDNHENAKHWKQMLQYRKIYSLQALPCVFQPAVALKGLTSNTYTFCFGRDSTMRGHVTTRGERHSVVGVEKASGLAVVWNVYALPFSLRR